MSFIIIIIIGGGQAGAHASETVRREGAATQQLRVILKFH
jgi:hypothetical protein